MLERMVGKSGHDWISKLFRHECEVAPLHKERLKSESGEFEHYCISHQCRNIHMGQIPQDGENACFMSFFYFFEALL